MGENCFTAEANTNAKHADTSHSGRHATGCPTAKDIELLRFELLRSALYHDMRQIALTRVHKLMLFMTVILGSGAIAAFGAAHPDVGQAAGAAVATIGGAQLVWDFAGGARDHRELRRRFYALLSRAQHVSDALELRAEMTSVYADEPPVVDRINRRAHNRAGLSIYGDDFQRA